MIELVFIDSDRTYDDLELISGLLEGFSTLQPSDKRSYFAFTINLIMVILVDFHFWCYNCLINSDWLLEIYKCMDFSKVNL